MGSTSTLGDPGVLRCPAVSCGVLRCPAVSCGVLRCPAVPCGALRCPAVPCGALRCPAVPCGALRCPAVPCGALRCPAVPCGALRCPGLPFDQNRVDLDFQCKHFLIEPWLFGIHSPRAQVNDPSFDRMLDLTDLGWKAWSKTEAMIFRTPGVVVSIPW